MLAISMNETIYPPNDDNIVKDIEDDDDIFPPEPTEEDYNYPLHPIVPSEEEVYPVVSQLLDDESPYDTIKQFEEPDNLQDSEIVYSIDVHIPSTKTEQIESALQECLENLDISSANTSTTAALNRNQLIPILMNSEPLSPLSEPKTDIIGSLVTWLLPQIHAFGVEKVGMSFEPIEKVRKEVLVTLLIFRERKGTRKRRKKRRKK